MEHLNSQDIGSVILFGNQKGGVGKTTNAINLAAALGQLGKRVLLIDTDPEASSTVGLGYEPERQAGLYEVCLGQYPLSSVILTERLPKNVHLVGSRSDCNHLPRMLNLGTDEEVYSLLRPHLHEARQLYDLVIVDSPPGPGSILAISGIANADYMVLSAKPDSFSFKSMQRAISNTIRPIRDNANPYLEVVGILICDVPTRSLSWYKDIWLPLAAQPDGGAAYLPFNRKIRRHALVIESQRNGHSVYEQPNRHWERYRGIIGDFSAVAEEILIRLGDLDGFYDGKMIDWSKIPETWERDVQRHIESQEADALKRDQEQTAQVEDVVDAA